MWEPNKEGKLSNTKKTVGATVTNESYYYNGLGTRIKKVTNGLEEKYLVDENTAYSRVLEEKDKDNKLTASYLYGNELISQNRSNIKSYYNRDGLGNTVSLCNSTGNVTDTYKYDGFGNLKVSTGTTKNNYLFAGEEFDKTTGYYNLRARYMDPSTGRFTGMDKYLGRIDDPVSLHKYLYANANPVNYTDPSGYFSLQELMESILSESALDSISMIKYNIIGLNMRLELTLAGRLLLEISQESVEMMLEGNVSLEGIMLSCVEVAYGMAGSEEDLSGKRKRGTKGATDAVSYKRPSRFRKGVRDKAWENSKNANGDVIDPLTGKVMDKSEPWDMGHKPGVEFRKHKQSAEERGIPRKQFLDEHNNPDHYIPELPSSNRGHKGEDLTDNYFGD